MELALVFLVLVLEPRTRQEPGTLTLKICKTNNQSKSGEHWVNPEEEDWSQDQI